MRTHLLLPFATTTLLCLCLLAGGQRGGSQPPGKGPMKKSPDDIFKWISRDKGYISIDDQQPGKGKEEMELFAKENKITTGKITRDQFLRYWEQRDELRKKTAADPKITDERAADNFRRYDVNSDSFLNLDEISNLRGPLRSFKDEWQKWDANKDGLIDRKEWTTYYRDYNKRRIEAQATRASNAKSAAPGSKAIIKIIIEEDEEIVPSTYHVGGKLPAGLPAWFAERDTDGDGQVSLYEWRLGKKDVAEFLKMDRNDDGFLTAEEMLHYQRQASAPGRQPAAVPVTTSTRPEVPSRPGFPYRKKGKKKGG